MTTFGTNDNARDDVQDILVNYLMHVDNKEKFELQLIPKKEMDEFDCAAILDESGIKVWQWRKI